MPSHVSTPTARPSEKPSPDSTSSTFSSASQYSTPLSSGGEDFAEEASKAQLEAPTRSRTQSAKRNSDNLPQPSLLSANHVTSSTSNTSNPSNASTPRPQSRARPTSSPSTLKPAAATVQLSPPKGSYTSRQATASFPDTRSPAIKRAPASRSSHGIETASGPPPALSTQRSYTAETPRSFYQPVDFPKTSTPTHTTGTVDFAAARPSTSSGVPETDVMFDRRSSRMSVQEDDKDRTLTLRDSEEEHGGDETVSSQEDIFLNLAQQERVQSAGSELAGPRRRSVVDRSSRVQPRTISTRPHSSGRLFPSDASISARHESPQWHAFRRDLRTDSALSSRDNSPRDRTYAASAHPLDGRIRQRYEPQTSFVLRTRRGSEQGETPEMTARYEDGRAARFQEPSTGLYHSSPLTRQSTVNARHNRISKSFDTGETGSTVSTTAPSTVWDELDDMKSRLKKLEAMGVTMPQSSQQAINNNTFAQQPRPATATTTMTTISSSPKHKLANHQQQNHDPSPDSSALKGAVDPSIHPLLHTALAKANTVLAPEIYKTLESSAIDALRLVMMTKEVKNLQPSDRQIRRKADNLCRSLTELCISLSDSHNASPRAQLFPSSISRPSSNDTGPGAPATEGSTYHSANSSPTLKATPTASTIALEQNDDNDLTRASSRVMSRIEARRSSLQVLNANNNLHSNGSTESRTPTYRKGSSPLEGVTPTQATPSLISSSSRTAAQRDPQAPPSRATSLLLRRRTRPIGGGGVGGDADSSDNGSAFSTAGLTRSNTSRLARDRERERERTRDREPREYTSSFPLPRPSDLPQQRYDPQQRPADLSPELPRPNLPTRRNYFASQPRDSPISNNGNNPNNPNRAPTTPPVSTGMIAGHVRRNYLDRNTPPRGPEQQHQYQQKPTHNDATSTVSTSQLLPRRERASVGAAAAAAPAPGHSPGQYPSTGTRLLLGARRRSQRGEE